MYIKDAYTLLLKNFKYDGKGPDAYFYVGLHGEPSGLGIKLEYPYGDGESILPEVTGEDVEIILPEGIESSKLKWFSVWCRQFDVSFGDVYFDEADGDMEEIEVGQLTSFQHGVQASFRNTHHQHPPLDKVNTSLLAFFTSNWNLYTHDNACYYYCRALCSSKMRTHYYSRTLSMMERDQMPFSTWAQMVNPVHRDSS